MACGLPPLRLLVAFVRRLALRRWLVVSRSLPECSDSLAEPLADFTQPFRAEHEQRDHQNDSRCIGWNSPSNIPTSPGNSTPA